MEHSDSPPHFLCSFMNPAAVAVFGANEKIPDNMGAFQLLTLIDNGYSGKIYPIHPALPSVFGIPAYPSVLAVPGPVDLALIILSKKVVFDVLEELGQKGCRNVIMVTAGFREQHDQEGQRQLRSIKEKYGMHILGPNCIGILNTHCRYDPSLPQEAPPRSEKSCILNTTVQSYNEPPGHVSIISQSGTFVSHTFMLLRERRLALAQAFSVGNEDDIDLCDCLEYLGQDADTRVILMYIEEIKRGRRFLALVKAILPNKRIIVI